MNNKTYSRFAGANIKPFLKSARAFLNYLSINPLRKQEILDFKKDRTRR